MTRIMIVDDNVDITATLKDIAEMEGYEAEIANNGAEFLEKVETIKPELVLLDIMMPGLTTRQILEGLVKKGLSTIKIIFVTVVRFSEEELKTLQSQFNVVDYVKKPFNVTNLIEKVKEHV